MCGLVGVHFLGVAACHRTRGGFVRRDPVVRDRLADNLASVPLADDSSSRADSMLPLEGVSCAAACRRVRRPARRSSPATPMIWVTSANVRWCVHVFGLTLLHSTASDKACSRPSSFMVIRHLARAALSGRTVGTLHRHRPSTKELTFEGHLLRLLERHVPRPLAPLSHTWATCCSKGGRPARLAVPLRPAAER